MTHLKPKFTRTFLNKRGDIKALLQPEDIAIILKGSWVTGMAGKEKDLLTLGHLL